MSKRTSTLSKTSKSKQNSKLQFKQQQKSSKPNRSKGKSFTKLKTKRTFIPPQYPAIIVTSDFDASHIAKLQQELDSKFIPVYLQSSKKKVKIQAGMPTDKFFIIQDQNTVQQLKGQFLQLQNAKIVKYPKQNNIQKLIQIYSKYFGLGNYKEEKQQEEYNQFWEQQQQNQKIVDGVQENLKESGLTNYFSASNQNIGMPLNSNIKIPAMITSSISNSTPFGSSMVKSMPLNTFIRNQSTTPTKSGIRLKSITKFNFQEAFQKTSRNLGSQMAIFIIYQNQHESKMFKEYVASLRDKGQIVDIKNLKKMNLKRRQLIRVHLIDQYQKIMKAITAEEDGKKIKIKKYLLMGQYSQKKFIPYFKKIDQIFILCNNQKACIKAIKDNSADNVANATIDPLEMDNLIKQRNFFRLGEGSTSQQPYFLRMNSKGTTLVQKRASTTSMKFEPTGFMGGNNNDLYVSNVKSLQSERPYYDKEKSIVSDRGNKAFVTPNKIVQKRRISNINIKYPQQPQLKHYHMPEPVNEKVVKFTGQKNGLHRVEQQQQDSKSRCQEVPSPSKKKSKIKKVFMKSGAKGQNKKIANKQSQIQQQNSSEESQSLEESQQLLQKSSEMSYASQSSQQAQQMKVSVMDQDYYTSSIQEQKAEAPLLKKSKAKQKTKRILKVSKVSQNIINSSKKSHNIIQTDKSKRKINSLASMGLASNSLIGILAGNGNPDDYQRYQDNIKQLQVDQSRKNIFKVQNYILNQPQILKQSTVKNIIPLFNKFTEKQKQLEDQNTRLKLEKMQIQQKMQDQLQKHLQKQNQLSLNQLKLMQLSNDVGKQNQDKMKILQNQLKNLNGALQQEKSKLLNQISLLKQNIDEEQKKKNDLQKQFNKQKQNYQNQKNLLKQQALQKYKKLQERQKNYQKQIEEQKQKQLKKAFNQYQEQKKQNQKRRDSHFKAKAQIQNLKKKLQEKQKIKSVPLADQNLSDLNKLKKNKSNQNINENESEDNQATKVFKRNSKKRSKDEINFSKILKQQSDDQETRNKKRTTHKDQKPTQQIKSRQKQTPKKVFRSQSKKLSRFSHRSVDSSKLIKQKSNSCKKVKITPILSTAEFRINQSQISNEDIKVQNQRKNQNNDPIINEYYQGSKNLNQNVNQLKNGNNPKNNDDKKLKQREIVKNQNKIYKLPENQNPNYNIYYNDRDRVHTISGNTPWYNNTKQDLQNKYYKNFNLFDQKSLRNRSNSLNKHKNLSPFGVNLDDYDKFIENGITVYRKKPHLSYKNSLPKGQTKINSLNSYSNLNRPQFNNFQRDPLKSIQKQQFLIKNAPKQNNKNKIYDNYQTKKLNQKSNNPQFDNYLKQNKPSLSSLNYYHPNNNNQNINVLLSKILTSRPQNNYFTQNIVFSNKNKNQIPTHSNYISPIKQAMRSQLNNIPFNNENTISNNRLRQAYQLDDKQNRKTGKPPIARKPRSKSNDYNLKMSKTSPQSYKTHSNNYPRNSNFKNQINNNEINQNSNKNKNNESLQQDPQILYLIPRNKQNTNLSQKIKKILSSKDNLYSYISPSHLLNQIQQAQLVYDIVFIFEGQKNQNLSQKLSNNQLSLYENCYLTNIDKNSPNRVQENRVYVNSPSDLPNLAKNLLKSEEQNLSKNYQDRNNLRKKLNKQKDQGDQTFYLFLYKKFNPQFKSISNNLIKKIKKCENNYINSGQYFLPNEVIYFLQQNLNEKKTYSIIISDEVGLQDLIDQMVNFKRSDIRNDQNLMFILVIPRGEHYQYSYQKFGELQIQDLYELGISVNWIARTQFYQKEDKVLKLIQQSIR